MDFEVYVTRVRTWSTNLPITSELPQKRRCAYCYLMQTTFKNRLRCIKDVNIVT